MNPYSSQDEFENPFAAPEARPTPGYKATGDPWAQSSEEVDEVTRRAYIQHEASVRAIGSLNYIAMFFLGIIAPILIVFGIMAFIAPEQLNEENPEVLGAIMLVGGLFVLGVAVLSFFLGRGLRRLQPWSRWTQGVLSAIQIPASLIGLNPVGLLISGYITYLMFSEKSAFIFTDHYKGIMRRTPHIKPRTSIIVWIVLAIFIGLIVAGILIGILSGVGVI